MKRTPQAGNGLVTDLERSATPLPDSYRTWALSDGHAGNVRQAMALAQALAGDAASAQVLAPGRLARWFAPRVWPGAARAFGPSFARALRAPPALAIGCGRQAALGTRLLRRAGARVVQVLDPRVDPRHWDLVVVPEHDRLRGGNVLTLLGSLHPVDDAWLARARRDFARLDALPGPRTAVLVGGSSRHAPLDAAAIDALAALVDQALARDGGSVLLTASRRTDPAWHAPLRALAARWPGAHWLGPEDGDNPYPGLLAYADRIVCTADSVNMISEACATRVPVFAFRPDAVTGRPRRFLDALLDRGRMRAADGTLQPFASEPLRETARIAAEVRSRLGL